MKKSVGFRSYLMVTGMFILIMIYSSCSNDDVKGPVPAVTTLQPSEVSANSVVSGGEVTEDRGTGILETGVCWGTHEEITVADNKVKIAGSESFTAKIYGFLPERTYYVRAYATNNNGTGYGEALSFTTKEGLMDIDGNAYNIVKIGSQVWMADNLKTTKYNDGTEIPWVTNANKWSKLTTPAYTWYENDSLNYKHPYGALYNWYTVNTGVLCPQGWHIPSEKEFEILQNYLGGKEIAGGKLKETGTMHWNPPNTGATDLSGFMGVPGGNRWETGHFSHIGRTERLWDTKETLDNLGNETGWSLSLRYDSNWAGLSGVSKKHGSNVRCIKD